MLCMTQFSGPVFSYPDCGCEDGGSGPGSGIVGPGMYPGGPEPCGPGPQGDQPDELTPITSAQYRCSPVSDLQASVDEVRKINHELGLRPYRVFLVWQERDASRRWHEHLRFELTPVEVKTLDGVDLALREGGLEPEGSMVLTGVSPRQVNEDDLRGYLGGEVWGGDGDIDREFFFEVVLHETCGRPCKSQRRRFIHGVEPSRETFGWRVGLIDQEIARSRDGVDRSSPASSNGPRLVT